MITQIINKIEISVIINKVGIYTKINKALLAERADAKHRVNRPVK